MAKIDDFLLQVYDEHETVESIWPPIHSVHEGYALMLEEVEEFWEEVRKKEALHDPGLMYDELVQVAAMAARTATNLLMGPTLPSAD